MTAEILCCKADLQQIQIAVSIAAPLREFKAVKPLEQDMVRSPSITSRQVRKRREFQPRPRYRPLGPIVGQMCKTSSRRCAPRRGRRAAGCHFPSKDPRVGSSSSNPLRNCLGTIPGDCRRDRRARMDSQTFWPTAPVTAFRRRFDPRVLAQLLGIVSKVVSCRRTGPTGELPLCFRRQSVVPQRIMFREPRAERRASFQETLITG